MLECGEECVAWRKRQFRGDFEWTCLGGVSQGCGLQNLSAELKRLKRGAAPELRNSTRVGWGGLMEGDVLSAFFFFLSHLDRHSQFYSPFSLVFEVVL